jgi:hypothetical protein
MSDAPSRNCNHCKTVTTSTNPLKNCSRCKSVAYCNPTCQMADWPAHKLVCNKQAGADEDIRCVKIHGGPGGRYSRTTVKPTHSIFNSAPLPISTKIGFPLVMSRVIDRLPRGQETDNVHATWLNIDPVSGFAPEYWQGVGLGMSLLRRRIRVR